MGRKLIGKVKLPKALRGKLIGWKKCLAEVYPGRSGAGALYSGTHRTLFALVKLEIPATAARRGRLGEKCRAAEAKVLEIVRYERRDIFARYTKVKIGRAWSGGWHDLPHRFVYRTGKTVRCRRAFDLSEETCGSGIHFFLSRKSALRYGA